MNRPEFRNGHPLPEWLGAYHDGELDRSGAARVEAHLAGCADCRARLEELARLDAAAAALDDSLPGGDYWPGLEERIQRRLEQEGGSEQGDAVAPSGARPADSGWLPWLRKWFAAEYRPTLGWVAATAAGLALVILSSRVILHQGLPGEPSLGSRTASTRDQAAAPEFPDRAAPPAAVGQLPGAPPAGPTSATEKARGESGPAKPRQRDRMVTLPEAKTGTSAPDVPAARRETVAPAPAEAPTTRQAEGFAASPQPLPEEESAAGSTPGGQPLVPGLAAAPPASVPGSGDDPRAYATEVNAALSRPGAGNLTEAPPESQARRPVALDKARAGDQAAAVSQSPTGRSLKPIPPGAAQGIAPSESLPERAAEAGRRFAKPGSKSPFEDYSIAYAAAFRALEAGDFDLALRGFEIVARGVPESDLARDAEFELLLTRARQRLAGGAPPDAVLAEVAARAERAWDRVAGGGRNACREALALERLRLALLREFRPDADPAPFEERVARLKSCS